MSGIVSKEEPDVFIRRATRRNRAEDWAQHLRPRKTDDPG
jgi:hypothetical protein